MPAKRTPARKPLVQYDARGYVDTHGKQKPVRIVIHTTESHDYPGVADMKGIVDYWARTPEGLGAHLIIDAEGNTALCGNPDQVMYAVSRRNTGSVHIELVGRARFIPSIWWTRLKQLNKAAKWCAWLNLEYGIPLQFHVDNGISGHRHQPNQTHWDPGVFFPMKYLIAKAKFFRAKGWQ